MCSSYIEGIRFLCRQTYKGVFVCLRKVSVNDVSVRRGSWYDRWSLCSCLSNTGTEVLQAIVLTKTPVSTQRLLNGVKIFITVSLCRYHTYSSKSSCSGMSILTLSVLFQRSLLRVGPRTLYLSSIDPFLDPRWSPIFHRCSRKLRFPSRTCYRELVGHLRDIYQVVPNTYPVPISFTLCHCRLWLSTLLNA